MTKLEPCPFCGAPAVGDENAYGTGYMVGCSADCVLSPYVELASEAEAIAAWNTRTPPTSQSDAFEAKWEKLQEASLEASQSDEALVVQTVETVTGEFFTEPGEPFYRIVIDDYCADFDHREAAENFANAIAAREASAHAKGRREGIEEAAEAYEAEAETWNELGPRKSAAKRQGAKAIRALTEKQP